jgi:hypothetical protein
LTHGFSTHRFVTHRFVTHRFVTHRFVTHRQPPAGDARLAPPLAVSL